MADDKQGRDEQAHNADRRQRERDLRTELERRDEAEPPVDDADLEELEADLREVDFPATGPELIDALGERRLSTGRETYAVEDLLPDTPVETFETPEFVRTRVERPTVATAMKRIVEASETISNVEFAAGQRHAYEKTLRALQAVDTLDEDESVRTITDWIVAQIDQNGKLPESRAVRRRGAKISRASGYVVRTDEWLSV